MTLALESFGERSTRRKHAARPIDERARGDPALRRLIVQLLEARLRAGLTQEEVARRLGTQASAISRLESGRCNRPLLTTIENYALAVGCRVELRLRPWP